MVGYSGVLERLCQKYNEIFFSEHGFRTEKLEKPSVKFGLPMTHTVASQLRSTPIKYVS